MEQNDGHILTVENRKRLSVTQVEAVESFSPTQLVLIYVGGKIVVTGSDMKITSFSKSSGSFSANGTITSVKYMQKGVGLRQKLFR